MEQSPIHSFIHPFERSFGSFVRSFACIFAQNHCKRESKRDVCILNLMEHILQAKTETAALNLTLTCVGCLMLEHWMAYHSVLMHLSKRSIKFFLSKYTSPPYIQHWNRKLGHFYFDSKIIAHSMQNKYRKSTFQSFPFVAPFNHLTISKNNCSGWSNGKLAKC